MSRTASPVALAALLLALASPLAAQQDSQRPVPPKATEQPRTVEPRRAEPRPQVRRDPPAVERPDPQRETPRQVEPRRQEPRSTGEPELRRRKPE